MCFSAPASFIVSGTLAVISVASFAESKTKKQKLLSLVIVGFTLQQLFEGYQWLAGSSGNVNMLAAYGFLFFAFLFWTTYIPFIVLLNEESPRPILWWFLVAGITSSAISLYALLNYPLTISILQHSIRYSLYMPYPILGSILYALAISGSLFSSKKQRVQIFGIVVTYSGLIAFYFYEVTFVSVWCFFSAVLSALIYLHIRRENAPVSLQD